MNPTTRLHIALLGLLAACIFAGWPSLRAAEDAKPPASGPASKGAPKAEVYQTWPFDAKEAAWRQDQTATALGLPKEVTLDLGDKVTMKFILIPAGKFMMGSTNSEKDHAANEAPQHEVTITKPFYMAIYKVTQEQYQQVMGANPSKHPGKTFVTDSVQWDDAVEFCKKVSDKTGKKVRLPTEAQWEDACRAGTATRYFFGDDETKLGDYAWFRDNNDGVMHPPGQKKPNAWSLYDMHGLMWEWCSDFFAEDAYAGRQNAVDPQGPATGTKHTARAGTWGSRFFMLRNASRIGAGVLTEAGGADRFGMRVAMDAE